jgi:hypothetical protein
MSRFRTVLGQITVRGFAGAGQVKPMARSWGQNGWQSAAAGGRTLICVVMCNHRFIPFMEPSIFSAIGGGVRTIWTSPDS